MALSLNNIELKNGVVIKYIPHHTYYTVRQVGVLVKDSDDSWQEGVIYQETGFPSQTFVRPYRLFNEENWVAL